MNPKNPSREDIELRITMLLLGELSEAEAEALREMIARDAAFKKLHDELQATIGLVREVQKTPADTVSENSAGLKLSDERREKLLAHFKTPRPQESFWIRPMKLEMPSLIPALVVVAIIAVLAAMLLPALSKAKNKAARATPASGFRVNFANSSVAQSEAKTDNLSEGKTDREMVVINGQPASQPTTITVAPAPVLAPPPAPAIVLPPTEAPAAVTTSSLGDSGKGGVYSQNIVGYVNTPVGAGTLIAPTATPAAPAVTYGVQPASGDQAVAATLGANPNGIFPGQAGGTTFASTADGKEMPLRDRLPVDPNKFYSGLDSAALEPEAKPVATIDPSTGLPVQQSIASVDRRAAGNNGGAVVGVVNAFGGVGGLRNTGSGGGGGGGGGGAGGPQPTISPAHALDDVSVNRSRTENGPVNIGEEFRPATPPSTVGATVTYDAPIFSAAPSPALDSAPARPGDVVVTTYSDGMQREGGEMRFSSSEITKGAAQLHSSEPASSSRSRTVKITPLPGARAAVGAMENNDVALAFNTAPAETPPAAQPRATQMRASPVRSIINDVGFAQATDTSSDGDANGQVGKKLERSPARQQVIANGAIDGFTTPPAAAGVPVLGDVPASGKLFASGAGNASAEPVDKSGRGELALNGTGTWAGGTVVNAGSTTLGAPQNSPQTRSFKEQQRLPGISSVAAEDAEYEHQLVQAQRQREMRAAKNGRNTNGFFNMLISDDGTVGKAGNTTVGTSQNSWQTASTKDDVAGLRYITATNAVVLADSAAPAQKEEMLPPGLVDFTAADAAQVLDVYGKLVNRTVVRSALPDVKITLKTQKPMTRKELVATLEATLASNNISVIPMGDKFLKVVSADQANSAGTALDRTKNNVASIDEADAPVRRAPANAPVPQPEILASENAFSTFALNVSDVSFKLAEASLEKGQMPDAAGIRSEEFINAFDYRDPEAAAGQPMAFTSERARYPFAHNRELLRFSIKTAAAGRPAGRALNLVLLLDNSGSMERADRVAIIREALRVLAGQLQPQDTVSVVTFARTARLWADGVAGDKAGETLAQVGDITPEGGTNLEEAMRLAYETVRRHYLASGLNRVVLLTDGAANLGNVDPGALKQKVEAQRKQGIALDCFGIGFEGYDDDLLEQLSRNGDGRYAFINSPEEAGKEFAAKLAGALQIAASDVKVQVEFNPARVISYRQIGYAKHQLTKEQFRDNTVDAAEIAAQEAGNALYTVETKPNGTGPVATVHVRYKVPGTMDYQERSWDVAYEGNVPALEQASAAMRLAGTASAFSEWLAVSPFAQEVTPDDLLKIISGVPEVYGADERPKKLEWMIRQAKSLSGK